MARSTPWREILGMPASSRAILSGAVQSTVMECQSIKHRAKEKPEVYSSGSFALHSGNTRIVTDSTKGIGYISKGD